MSIIVGNCRKHGPECRCTPGLVTEALELWGQCTDERHKTAEITMVCCDQGHEFCQEPGDVLGTERRVEDRFPAEQAGHVWIDTPRCREHCPNHGQRRGERRFVR